MGTMDTRKYMIILKDKIRTSEVKFCEYNSVTKKEERKAYLKKHRKISVYNSENLMYSLLEDILMMPEFTHLEILCHFPINMLIKNTELLNEKEYNESGYAS